jgi:hypothetical protein
MLQTLPVGLSRAGKDLLPVQRGLYMVVFEKVLDGVYIVADSSKKYNLCIY